MRQRKNINWFRELLAIVGWTVAVIVVGIAMMGCATKKELHEHQTHVVEVDSLAVQQQVDKRMQAWHERMDSSWRQRIDEYSASWTSHDDEKELTTETITTWVDSLGREMRQEQRTTERTLSREQQQTEQRLTQEMDARIQHAVDRQDSIWRQRMDAVVLQMRDSLTRQRDKVKEPVAVPWWQQWWNTLAVLLFVAALVAVGLWARKHLHV